MMELKLGDILDQDPKVLFKEQHNKHFFAPNQLADHQNYIRENDGGRTVKKPLTGDVFKAPDGEYYCIVEMVNLGTFQLTHMPGNTYIDKCYRSYSGSYAFETLEYWTSLDKLVLTGATDTVRAWNFLDGSAGAKRGVVWSLRVPVWEIKK